MVTEFKSKKRLKDEKYNGVIIEFHKELSGEVRARLPAHGLAGTGQTKREAFEDAKDSIRFLKERGNI